jgi:hypothetical protein
MVLQQIVFLSGYEDIKAVHSSDHAEARQVSGAGFFTTFLRTGFVSLNSL